LPKKVLFEGSKPLNPPLISVVVPIYKEEANVEPLIQRLEQVFHRIGCRWEVVFALDPSPDRTKQKISELLEKGFPIRLITFSRRIGKPLSLLAGLDHARGDACVIIDADLQDPPELIEAMAQKWGEGFKVVIAQRKSRKGENPLYLGCAKLFYWLLDKVSEVKVPRNTGDFRLLDARVVREVCRFRERHAFLRGLCASAGFSTAVVPFDRDPRLSGKAHISFLGAFNIALDGIIPFSRTPVRLMALLGLIMVVPALAAGILWLLHGLIKGFSASWATELLCMLVVGGVGLIVAGLGVVGEYVVRTYEETRDRPLYIVDEIFGPEDGAPTESLSETREDHDPPSMGVSES
jgi:polyisoprenyl-phosphate glycosyltransferase